MESSDTWAVGVDLGGTKVEVARVDSAGRVHQRLRRLTNVKEGPEAVKKEIVDLARELQKLAESSPIRVGIGLAGQESLPAATKSLQVLRAKLGSDAGVVGAATLALQTFKNEDRPGG